MNKVVLVIMLLLLGFGSSAQQINGANAKGGKTQATTSKEEVKFPDASQFKNRSITTNIISATNNTWCYDILVDGKILIHQPSKPGMEGNEGFKTKVIAQKVAALVIQKIKNGEMPPSVTREEMKKIGAL